MTEPALVTAATLLVTVTVAALAAPAAAQTAGLAAGPSLTADLAAGDGVYVTDLSGRRRKGTVRETSRAGLSFTDGSRSWTLTSTEVRKIELQDPLLNGAGYGMATVAGIVVAGCAAIGSRPGECAFALVYSLPGIAIGGAIGALVDALQHETVYDRAPQVTVVPVVSGDRIGAEFALRW